MARDWIQMRVWLKKDPKVIQMADYLAGQRAFMDWLTEPVHQTCRESAYEHVTRNVTVALCVTGLCVTWGAAREQGDRDGDDLIVKNCNLETIAAISDTPCFGDAMAFVGWARCGKNNSTTFPNFFREAELPHERHRRANAERQARYRDRQKGKGTRDNNVTGNALHNVTVTPREEKSKSIDPPPLTPPPRRDDEEGNTPATNGTPQSQLIAELRAAPFGLAAARDCLETAQENGVTLPEVRALMEHFRTQGQWSPAQLYDRISRACPGEDPTTCWPARDRNKPAAPYRQPVDQDVLASNREWIAKQQRVKDARREAEAVS